jgi:hypothetical protein
LVDEVALRGQALEIGKHRMRSQGPSKPSSGHFFLDIDLRLD